jgi:predicted nucleotidyltransferase
MGFSKKIMNPIFQARINEIRKICKTYQVRDLYSFGSVNTSTFRDDSDIDLLISFKDISIEEYSNNYFDLHYKFEELFNRSVDLITENSLSNPYFIKSVDQTKTLIYAG